MDLGLIMFGYIFDKPNRQGLHIKKFSTTSYLCDALKLRYMIRCVYLFLLVFIVASCKSNEGYKTNKGFVFGTTYTFIYKSDEDLNEKVMERLKLYDMSLSTYNKESLISKVNRNEEVDVDTFFTKVFRKAEEIYSLSGGAFDITVKPLSSLWKFDGHRHDTITVEQYEALMRVAKDSLSAFVGMDKVRLEGTRVVKVDNRVQLNANALAEGCGIDLAASVLDEYGVTDYMVEIGGELRLKGRNPKGERWRIGIDSPTEENEIWNRQLQRVVSLTDCAVSSSGGYRQYIWREDGQRLSHIIDPRLGVPVQSEIMSVTVVGPNTMTTDALATTFTVVGIDKTLQMMQTLEDIEVYIIYSDDNGQMKEVVFGKNNYGLVEQIKTEK